MRHKSIESPELLSNDAYAQHLTEKLLEWSQQRVDFFELLNYYFLFPSHFQDGSFKVEKKIFKVPNKPFYWALFNSLGFKPITEDILQFVMASFNKIELTDRDIIVLLERLQNFYHCWALSLVCIENNPLNKWIRKKSQHLLNLFLKHRICFSLNSRQISSYAGLNVLILLLFLDRYLRPLAGIKPGAFYFCISENNNPKQLLNIINYSDCTEGFNTIVGPFLSEAVLDNINLTGVDLNRANLSGTDLSRANLAFANLAFANLSHANLSSAKLQYTNLTGANLQGANLDNTDFRDADLSGAYLCGAQALDCLFEMTNMSGANLSNTILVGSKIISSNASFANFNNADLRYSFIHNTDFSEASFTGAKLHTSQI